MEIGSEILGEAGVKKPLSQFCGLYKDTKNHTTERQDDRRKYILKQQKLKRKECFDTGRQCLEFVENLQALQEKSRNKTVRKFEGFLQLSEWMTERPEDLNSWYLVPCPKGRRCVVVAADHCTKEYNNSGRLRSKFHSNLPGDKNNSVSILDCVFDEHLQEYWVLDVIAYNNQDYVDCDAEFRFYWIRSKLEEEQLSTVGGRNNYAFKAIPFYDCANEMSIESCLLMYPQFDGDTPALDGFLFYHKESSYVKGKTPLVCWLFAFMIPEVLHFDTINFNYLSQKPENYVDYQSFIVQFDMDLAKKKKRHRRSHGKQIKNDMEVAVEDLSAVETIED